MRSIKDFQKHTGIELTDSYKAIDTKVWSIIQQGNKHEITGRWGSNIYLSVHVYDPCVCSYKL